MAGKTIFMSQSEYDYYLSISLRELPVLKKLRKIMQKHPFGDFQISPEQGQFMSFLTKLMNVKNYLEIGTFTGYSSLVVAKAMSSSGKIVTCDLSEDWTMIAKKFWKESNVENKIDLRVGDANKTLDYLIKFEKKVDFFDLAFIDADKLNHNNYYEYCLKLVKPGGVILLDNIFRHKKVMAKNKDRVSIEVDKLNRKIFKDKRVILSVLPISDGLTLLYKK